MIYAAEIATETDLYIVADKDGRQFLHRYTYLLNWLGDDVDTEAVGTVDCDDYDDALRRITLGQWEYSQRV
jgi:hypothetical protein